MRKTLTLLTMVFFLSACDHTYDYTYQVINLSGGQLQINLTTKHGENTTHMVEANETKVILIVDHGIEAANGPYFSEVNIDLEALNITKDDTLSSDRDYLSSSSWDYDDGVYTAKISKAEFR